VLDDGTSNSELSCQYPDAYACRHGARTPLSKREELWRQLGTQWDVCRQAYDMVPLTLTTSDGGQDHFSILPIECIWKQPIHMQENPLHVAVAIVSTDL
jgi:hypothetical protein